MCVCIRWSKCCRRPRRTSCKPQGIIIPNWFEQQPLSLVCPSSREMVAGKHSSHLHFHFHSFPLLSFFCARHWFVFKLLQYYWNCWNNQEFSMATWKQGKCTSSKLNGAWVLFQNDNSKILFMSKGEYFGCFKLRKCILNLYYDAWILTDLW